MIRKLLVLERCTQCGHCEWIGGSPRCKHPDMEKRKSDMWDCCVYQKVPTDGRMFHENCPLPDVNR